MIVRRVLGLLGWGLSSSADAAQIAVLRHQLAVLPRQVPRARYTPADRMVLAMLARLLPGQRWAVFPGHARDCAAVASGVDRAWGWKYPGKGRDRRGLHEQIAALVVGLARVLGLDRPVTTSGLVELPNNTAVAIRHSARPRADRPQ
jgi:hypothetical protein